jgi:NADPH2:quinone reductase
LFSVPPGLDRSEAAAVVLNYVAASQMLHRAARVKRGGSILVHGAAGGVGSALVQLAKLAGLTVYGTASEAKLEFIEKLGAIPVERRISFVHDLKGKMGTGHPGVDAVFDSIGPEFWKEDRQVLRSGGELVTFGSQFAYRPGDHAEGKNWQQPFAKARGLFGAARRSQSYSITEWRKQHPEWFHQDLTQMLHYLHEKRIKPVIGQTFPWQDAAQAHAMLENRELTGKAVLLF